MLLVRRPRALYAAFDRFPTRKGASTHIARFAPALFEEYGGGLLYVVGDERLPAHQLEGDVEIVRFSVPLPNLLERAVAFGGAPRPPPRRGRRRSRGLPLPRPVVRRPDPRAAPPVRDRLRGQRPAVHRAAVRLPLDRPADAREDPRRRELLPRRRRPDRHPVTDDARLPRDARRPPLEDRRRAERRGPRPAAPAPFRGSRCLPDLLRRAPVLAGRRHAPPGLRPARRPGRAPARRLRLRPFPPGARRRRSSRRSSAWASGSSGAGSSRNPSSSPGSRTRCSPSLPSAPARATWSRGAPR